ncbi:MAG: MerR family transcriptional regulator [Thiomonas sp. 20-64-9]|nr:MAG: MerR family transcriptional regulator [Thiomonas sp. 20-64-9]
MSTSDTSAPLRGIVLEEQVEVSMDDLCAVCRVERTQIVHLVEEGVIDLLPSMRSATQLAQWRFSGEALSRARRAVRLQRDLELNAAATALVLDLLDQIDALRRGAQH